MILYATCKLVLFVYMIDGQAENRFMRQDDTRILNGFLLHQLREQSHGYRTRSYIGWATVVNRGRTIEAMRMLSTLMIEKSSGTLRPSSCML